MRFLHLLRTALKSRHLNFLASKIIHLNLRHAKKIENGKFLHQCCSVLQNKAGHSHLPARDANISLFCDRGTQLRRVLKPVLGKARQTGSWSGTKQKWVLLVMTAPSKTLNNLHVTGLLLRTLEKYLKM